MSADNLVWNDVAPYVVYRRQSHELGAQRAEKMASFIRHELTCEHVEVRLRGENGPGPEYGSCSRFFVYFDQAWQPIGESRENRRYDIELAVSERGPFVVSSGGEWRQERQPWEGGKMWVSAHHSAEASARAKALALWVAAEFDLKYVDANWLRRIRLSRKELPWDDVGESLDIDHDEPTALNILFDEEM